MIFGYEKGTLIYSFFIPFVLSAFLTSLYVFLIKNKKFNISISLTCILFFIFFVYITIYNLVCNNIFFIYTLLLGSIFFMLYILLYMYNMKEKYIIIIYILIGLSIFESVLSLIQYYIFKTELIAGSFNNPSVLAAFLLSSVPYIYIIKIKNIYKLLLLLFISYIIILTDSRCGFIAMLLFWLIFLYVHMRKYRIIICILSSFILIMFIIAIWFYKRDSSEGRLFILNNTFELLSDSPLSGIGGEKRFLGRYMIYQKSFFEKNSEEEKILLLSDNINHPLNEYIRIWVEYGVFAFLILILIALETLYNIINKSKLSLVASISNSLLLFMAFFSHIFDYIVIWILLATNVYFISYDGKVNIIIKKTVIKFISLFTMLLCIILFVMHTQWFIASFSENKIEKYNFLYNISYFSKNPFFIYDYSKVLSNNNNFRESIIVLKKNSLLINDYNTQIILAYNYYKLKKYQKAEYHSLAAKDMCPNRFYPLYYLLEIYKEKNDIRKAKEIAKIIINKPIKIDSYEIQNIILQARLFLLIQEGI